MILFSYDVNNLKKHRISSWQVDEVLAAQFKIEVPLEVSELGNARYMVVGFTEAGRLLEIGVELVNDSSVHIFHAKRATRLLREEFERSIRHEE
ncbi:MAG: hypothetical protein K2X29_09875 [Candidatus Obscuribacterales bacterium]|nr:hypothetical protein [Candidatus Obscuribacterales bacterium]